MAATVFVFEGTAHYAHPGIEWAMATVQEDYAPARELKCEWTKTLYWLVANGYRCLWSTPTELSGKDAKQVWGKVSVFGDTNVRYTGSYAVKARYEHWLAKQQPKEEQPSPSERMLQQLARARAYETCQYANAHPELTAREVNEMMKARACGNV